jgi:biopolymer transport protein ExbB
MLDTLIVDATLLALLLLSVVTWTIALWKWQLNRQIQKRSAQFESDFWARKNWSEAQAAVQAAQGDLVQIAASGFKAYEEMQGTRGDLRPWMDPVEAIERPMRQSMQLVLRRQERGLSELGTIGSTAPFIGLFGTVWGIMDALKTIGVTGQASIDVVAGPIGEALIATAVGIITAIPAVLLYNYFVRAQKLRITQMEGFIEAYTRMAARHLASQEKQP